jgi:hypothetical protein
MKTTVVDLETDAYELGQLEKYERKVSASRSKCDDWKKESHKTDKKSIRPRHFDKAYLYQEEES